MIKIHTELVWTPTSPIRRWCPFGVCPEKSLCVWFLQKGPPLHAPKLNAIGEEEWDNCFKTALLLQTSTKTRKEPSVDLLSTIFR